jgi:hypothetical protein
MSDSLYGFFSSISLCGCQRQEKSYRRMYIVYIMVALSNDAQPRCMQISFCVNVALGGGALSVTATQCAVN